MGLVFSAGTSILPTRFPAPAVVDEGPEADVDVVCPIANCENNNIANTAA